MKYGKFASLDQFNTWQTKQLKHLRLNGVTALTTPIVIDEVVFAVIPDEIGFSGELVDELPNKVKQTEVSELNQNNQERLDKTYGKSKVKRRK